jgi:aminobenzoyl-glutamate transport protein
VEPRLSADRPVDDLLPDTQPVALTDGERRGLGLAGLALALLLALVLLATLVPGAPLHGPGDRFPRWVEATVPLLFIFFAVPGIAYGFAADTLRNDRDVARLMGETLSALGPYIVLAFFAAQFIESFNYSNLGEMLAITGGQALARASLEPALLMIAFVCVVLVGNLFVGSASAKYAFFAPVFVPMFMQVGISPELTQAAYRVGDSVSNIITPLNPYLIIVLAVMRRYVPESGIGTVVSLMLPYALVFAVTWSALLGLWIGAGWALGPAGTLSYIPFTG